MTIYQNCNARHEKPYRLLTKAVQVILKIFALLLMYFVTPLKVEYKSLLLKITHTSETEHRNPWARNDLDAVSQSTRFHGTRRPCSSPIYSFNYNFLRSLARAHVLESYFFFYKKECNWNILVGRFWRIIFSTEYVSRLYLCFTWHSSKFVFNCVIIQCIYNSIGIHQFNF